MSGSRSAGGAGVREQRRVDPVGALEVVVAAERVLAPHDDVGVVEDVLLVAQEVGADRFLLDTAVCSVG